MRTAKLIVSASAAVALLSTPVLAAPAGGRVSLSNAVAAGAPLRAGTKVRKSQKQGLGKGLGAPLLAGFGLAAVIVTIVATQSKNPISS